MTEDNQLENVLQEIKCFRNSEGYKEFQSIKKNVKKFKLLLKEEKELREKFNRGI